MGRSVGKKNGAVPLDKPAVCWAEPGYVWENGTAYRRGYIRQTCARAMSELICGRGREWRKRIQAALWEVHKRRHERGMRECMSAENRALWDACLPERFGKPFSSLTDEEVAQLGHALGGFLLSFHREDGARSAAKPKQRKVLPRKLQKQ